MKTNNIAKTLVTGVKVVTGVALQLVGFVIWIPARVGLGISEVLTDIGKQLVTIECAPERPIKKTEAIDANSVVTVDE